MTSKWVKALKARGYYNAFTKQEMKQNLKRELYLATYNLEACPASDKHEKMINEFLKVINLLQKMSLTNHDFSLCELTSEEKNEFDRFHQNISVDDTRLTTYNVFYEKTLLFIYNQMNIYVVNQDLFDILENLPDNPLIVKKQYSIDDILDRLEQLPIYVTLEFVKTIHISKEELIGWKTLPPQFLAGHVTERLNQQ